MPGARCFTNTLGDAESEAQAKAAALSAAKLAAAQGEEDDPYRLLPHFERAVHMLRAGFS